MAAVLVQAIIILSLDTGFDRSPLPSLPPHSLSVVTEIILKSEFDHTITFPLNFLTTKYTFLMYLKGYFHQNIIVKQHAPSLTEKALLIVYAFACVHMYI